MGNGYRRHLLTPSRIGSTLSPMESDDLLPRRPGDIAHKLSSEDLDPLSVEELAERIALLRSEIIRCEKRMISAKSHRASADALFRK